MIRFEFMGTQGIFDLAANNDSPFVVAGDSDDAAMLREHLESMYRQLTEGHLRPLYVPDMQWEVEKRLRDFGANVLEVTRRAISSDDDGRDY